ncbi:serine O-acetyltransferase EpsC [Flavobacterium sp. RHBU_3]|uniref:serine O-acetyltransferase EpsC n=1 Tax=Flavobacterium sp. RHBU_3 TaxID=3391184 RepID=UPI003985326C
MKHPIYTTNYLKSGVLPDMRHVGQWMEDLFQWLFCIGAQFADYSYFVQREKELETTFSGLLQLSGLTEEAAANTVAILHEKAPAIHALLEDDLKAIFMFDPAAKSRSEVLVSYPGFFAISVYRIAHELWVLKVPVLPRMLSEYVHGKTGIDIHPGATVGQRFFIDHGTGIVIGETSIIGNDVKVYQGVTLGALSVQKQDAEVKRHPSIGNGVTIYANATILGGRTFIGHGSIIGGNVWLTQSVPDESLVYHKSEITIKTKEVFPEPLNFVI